MKKMVFLSTLLLTISVSLSAVAQNVAYIYSEKVFTSMSSYNSAVSELTSYAESTEKEADKKLEEVKQLYSQYKNSSNTLSSSAKENLRKEIIEKEKAANGYAEERIEKKREELMKPIEDKVLKAIDDLAKAKGVDFILDLSVAQIALYKNPKLDYTELVKSMVK